VSLYWDKVRDGIKGKKVYFNAIIEPTPESRADDDAHTLFKPRGWVDLELLDGESIKDADPVKATADALLPFIAEKPRSVVECAAYIKELAGYGHGKRTVEDALALLVDRGLIVNPNKRGTRAQYRLREAGTLYVLPGDVE
jgi:hypothetical protein